MESWSNIREYFIEQACKYQTTVKLWDAQRVNGPLHQNYPEFLKLNEFTSPNRRLKIKVPDSQSAAKGHLRKLANGCNSIMKNYDAIKNRNLSRKDLDKVSKGLSRILNLCSNVLPATAHTNDQIHDLIR